MNNMMVLTKNSAKKQFLLTNEDFVNLPTIMSSVTIDKSGCRKTTYWYTINTVQEIAYRKWINKETLDKEIERRNTDRLRKLVEKQKEIEERRNSLINELAKFGLQIRDDSKLCMKFINNNEFNLEFVVDTCRKMNWLQTKTDYRRRLDEQIKEIEKTKGVCDTQEEAECLQFQIIEQFGGGCPWRNQ